jgi:hypothetical protein
VRSLLATQEFNVIGHFIYKKYVSGSGGGGGGSVSGSGGGVGEKDYSHDKHKQP